MIGHNRPGNNISPALEEGALRVKFDESPICLNVAALAYGSIELWRF
jgi:hypothetical protein